MTEGRTEKTPDHILVAEDDEVMSLVVTRALEEAGYQVTTVCNGVEAIESWSQGRFDALVLDVRMPELGGPEVMERVRKDDAEIPIILVTGDPDLDSARRAVASRACDYVIKPFMAEELVGKVGRAIDTHSLQEETRRQQRELEARYAEILSLQRQQKKLFHLLVGEMFEPLADLKFQIEMVTSGLVGTLNDEQKDVLVAAEGDLERLWKITRDLRDLELLKNENLYQNLEVFDLREALLEAARRAGSLSQGRDELVGVEADKTLEVHGDRDLMIRAVSSLTCGLLEAASPEAAIDLRGSSNTPLEYQVVLHSTDSRVPADVWERSLRGQELDDLAAAGISVPASLGLPLAWHIVQAVGGRIDVDTAVESTERAGPGTSMTLVMPSHAT